MDLNDWTLYLGVIALVIALPGPAALQCINSGVRHGSTRSLATVAGGTISSMVLMGLSLLTLGKVALAMPLLFDGARMLGMGYLMLLGVNTWRQDPMAVRQGQSGHGATLRRPLAAMWCDGFLVGISNPKDLLFFGALFPQFVDMRLPLGPQFTTLFVTWAVVDGVVMYGYVTLGQHLLHWLASPARLTWFQRASAAALMGAGAAMGLTRSAAA